MDFNFVNGRVATGGAISTPDDLKQLRDAGITHIIDCRLEFDDKQVLQNFWDQDKYVWLGVNDDGQPKPAAWFGAGIVFALDALRLPHTKVYCHCAAGVNRGPSMAYAVLRSLGYIPRDAWSAIKTNRPQAIIAYAGDADKAITSLGFE